MLTWRQSEMCTGSTGIKRLPDEVWRQGTHLDATISSMADAVVIYGLEEEVVHSNPAAEEMLGLSLEMGQLPLVDPQKLLGKEANAAQPLPTEDSPVARALRGEKVRGAVMVLDPAGRDLWVSISAAPIFVDATLVGAVAVFTDVTALHELQVQREDLLHAVSHDLRSPLTVIHGHAEILQRQADRVDLVRKNADAIVMGAKRMNAMVQDLVDLARFESGQLKLKREPVDLRSFVLDLRERLTGVLEAERIRVEAPEGLPGVSADPNRLERILMNLIGNALKYSDRGSEVTVSLAARNEEVVTAISDRGPGIPPEEMPLLFRQFRPMRPREPREGLGLGLHIAKTLVEAHGGSIWVERELREGSVFSFALPATTTTVPIGPTEE